MLLPRFSVARFVFKEHSWYNDTIFHPTISMLLIVIGVTGETRSDDLHQEVGYNNWKLLK